MIRKILLISTLILSLSAHAQYTVEVVPGEGSVGDNQVSGISSSKIPDFASAVISAISSTLNNYLLKSEIKAPTITRLVSGSGSYTPPAGVKWIEVEMVGGGAGGGGAGNLSTVVANASGTNGGATVFGGISAAGGTAGQWYMSGGGGPVTGSIAEAVILVSSQGGVAESGQLMPSTVNNTQLLGGAGGVSCFGSGGVSAAGGSGTMALAFGAGGGGGGGDPIASNRTGGGGGAGGCVRFIIPNPTSYNYQVGANGVGGAAGGGTTRSGNAGHSGVIIIKEYYQ